MMVQQVFGKRMILLEAIRIRRDDNPSRIRVVVNILLLLIWVL
jgi:hypothetical protein